MSGRLKKPLSERDRELKRKDFAKLVVKPLDERIKQAQADKKKEKKK